jgi:hypothetical protein
MALQPFVGPWSLFQFLNPIHSRKDFLDGGSPVARPLPTHRTTEIQNKSTQTSMPRVGFEPTTLVFEREKAFHVLDRAATMIGKFLLLLVCIGSPKHIKHKRKPRQHTQDEHNADDLLWRNMTITGIHSKILINRKILLLLTKYIITCMSAYVRDLYR